MIINRSENFIFVHVPKTAGTSVSSYLSQFTKAGDLDINEPLSDFATYHCDKFGLRKHSRAEEIRAFVGADAFGSAFKFAFVRNPYERLFSLYNFLRFKWRKWSGSGIMEEFEGFAKFVRSDFFSSARAETAVLDSIQRLFGSQVFWLCDADRKPLLDYVARVERLDADFTIICERIGLPIPAKSIERLNVTDGSDTLRALKKRMLAAFGLGGPPQDVGKRQETLQHAYSDEQTRKLVFERYAEDFETFGYSVDSPG